MAENQTCFIQTYYLPGLESFRYVISGVHLVASTSTVLLNALILFTIIKTKSLHKPSYLLIGNLSLTDFLVGFLVQPFAVITNLTYSDYKDVFCVSMFISRVVGYWVGMVSLFTLTLISADRAIALKYKNRYRTIVTTRHIMAFLVPWWIAAFIFVFNFTYFSLSPNFAHTLFLAIGGVLCTILVSCYTHAYYNLKKLTSSVANAETTNSTNAAFNIWKYSRTLNTMMIVLLTFIAFYLPYLCCAIVISSYHIVTFQESTFAVKAYKFLLVCEVIVMTNCSANPLLYLWRIKDLRQAVKRTLTFNNRFFQRNQSILEITRHRTIVTDNFKLSSRTDQHLDTTTGQTSMWESNIDIP